MLLLTTGDIAEEEVPCALVEFQSSAISRVATSTFGSESDLMSTALGQAALLEAAGSELAMQRAGVHTGVAPPSGDAWHFGDRR